MRAPLLILLIAANSFVASSCCTKAGCLDSNILREIVFRGFELEEIDSLQLIVYEKNTNFLTPLDTISEFDIDSSTDEKVFYLYLISVLPSLENYDLRLISLKKASNLEYRINNLQFDKTTCGNTCFLAKDADVIVLKNYSINGQLNSKGGRIEISK